MPKTLKEIDEEFFKEYQTQNSIPEHKIEEFYDLVVYSESEVQELKDIIENWKTRFKHAEIVYENKIKEKEKLQRENEELKNKLKYFHNKHWRGGK
jgi:hypothetical protein